MMEQEEKTPEQIYAETYPWDARIKGIDFRNPSYVEGRPNTINCEIFFPVDGVKQWIPITITPDEYPDLYARANKVASAR